MGIILPCNFILVIMVAVVTLLVAMQMVYKLFVQSDAHIHHYCQETHNNNISITCG